MANPLQSLPLATARKIDALCDHFEKAWKSEARPCIEAYLKQAADDTERREILRCLLQLELELQTRTGTESTRQEYLARFAADASVVESVLRDLANRTTSRQAAAESVSASGSPSPPRRKPTVPLPSKIGRFEVLQLLGQGAFGRVYRARDPQLQREVALKVPIQGSLETEEAIERFLKEARAAATLHHPNICPVHEVGQDQSQYFIVMALLEGKTLAGILKERKEPLPAGQVAQIVRKLALTLDAAHAKGVVHRDMKPANILIDSQRRDVIIMDFGLARHHKPGDAAQTHDGVVKGTPAYMSPEQAAGNMKKVGPASDIYSLGVILYELLTGRLPFAGTLNEVLGQVQHVEPAPPSKHRPDVDKTLEAICVKAMAKDPDQRYHSGAELARALGAYLKGVSSDGKEAKSGANPALTHVAERLSVEQRQETRAAIEEAVRRSRTPTGLILSGLGFLAVLIVAGVIVLFLRTNHTMVQVLLETNIDPELLRDGTITYFLNDDRLTLEQLRKPIELRPGQHVLVAKRGEVEIQRYVFMVRAGADGKQAEIAIIEKTPLPERPEGGFVSLFNGKDLTGWRTYPETTGDWKVENGVLVGRGPERNHLVTVRDDFTDFHFLVEAKINAKGKSGQVFRVQEFQQGAIPLGYEAQIDSGSHRNKTGSLYVQVGVATPAVNPIHEVLIPPDTWFTQEVIAQGNRIIIKVNGKVVTDYVDVQSTYRKGRLALQLWDPPTVVHFRQVKIKELKADDVGFAPLFNGKDLTGWVNTKGQPARWVVRDGYMEVVPGTGNIMTTAKFGPAFDLHVEFWIPKMLERKGQQRGNSGVFLQGRHEIQIMDGFENPEKSTASCGALFGFIGPSQNVCKPPETWQSFDITFQAPQVPGGGNAQKPGRLTLLHNGVRIIDNAEFGSALTGSALDRNVGQPGPIMLQDWGSTRAGGVRFRNIRIRERQSGAQAQVPPASKCAAATPVPQFDRSGKPHSAFIKTHESYVEVAKKGNVDVAFYGDAIVGNWRSEGKSIWAQHFEPLKAANFGVFGDRTQNLLWRILNGELDGMKPKVAVVLIGTNNSDPVQEVAEGVTEIVQTIRSKLPTTKVLLLGIFPRGQVLPNFVNNRVIEINKLIARLDDSQSVRFLDIGEKFKENGQIPAAIMADHVHLSARGYEIWADAMMPLLTEMLAEPESKQPAAQAEQKFEGEDLKILGQSGEFIVDAQGMQPFTNAQNRWSGNSQLRSRSFKQGEWVDLVLPVAADGNYILAASITKAGDYGIIQFLVDGKPVGKPFDGYNPEVVQIGPIELGTVRLKKGTAILRVEVVGTNPKSNGWRYLWGLDYLVLKPAP